MGSKKKKVEATKRSVFADQYKVFVTEKPEYRLVYLDDRKIALVTERVVLKFDAKGKPSKWVDILIGPPCREVVSAMAGVESKITYIGLDATLCHCPECKQGGTGGTEWVDFTLKDYRLGLRSLAEIKAEIEEQWKSPPPAVNLNDKLPVFIGGKA